MKHVKSACRYVGVAFMAAVLFCMSAFAVFAAEEVGVYDDRVVLPVSNAEDGEVRLYTYTIYDADNNKAGTVELRYGKDTGHYGVRLWITTDGEAVEIEYNSNYFSAYTSGLEIKNATWNAYFTGETFTCDVVEKVLPSIPAPASVSWDRSSKPGVITWSEVKESDGRYVIRLLRDGNSENYVSTSGYSGRIDLADEINESGNYIVTVKAVGDETTGDSEITESAVYVYEAPEERVGITTNVWWTAKEGETLPTVINWNPVPGAGGYEVWLRASKSGVTSYGRRLYNTGSGLATSIDWTSRIKELNTKEGEALEYTVTVRALAGNIEVVANARENEYATSEEYSTTGVVADVKSELDEATAENVIDVIDEAGIDTVAIAMQSDEDVLEQVKELEQEYAAANNIDVKAPEVTHPALNADKISVVGAGINAVSGGAINLNFSKVAAGKEETINEKLYKNAVQVSITLDSKDANDAEVETGTLKCPITITMLPPSNVALDKLIILHYHADGSYEYIYPAKNADGTITFSVTNFSTFVFAELVTYTNDGAGSNTGSSTGSNTGNSNRYDADDDDEDDSDDAAPAISEGLKSFTAFKKYMKSNGQYAKNEWIKSGDTWYYAGADSNLLTGWYQNAAGVWYFMDADCKMLTGWQKVNGVWYYLDAVNGDMKTGWFKDADGKWYYLDAVNGDMKMGWLQDTDGKWYYLGADGACLMNTTTPDGYQVDADGAWIQ